MSQKPFNSVERTRKSKLGDALFHAVSILRKKLGLSELDPNKSYDLKPF